MTLVRNEYVMTMMFILMILNRNINSFSALVGSLALGMTWFASPLPGYLSDRFGCRITNFIGGALCVTGLAVTSFSGSLNLMYFTHCLVFGLGVCFIYNCSYLVIAQYFKEKLSMATGIIALGASVGVLFTGPLLQVLLDSFGWRGTYRVVAAYLTIVCILSLTYNPNVQKRTEIEFINNNDDTERGKRSGISLYCSVWTFPTFAASVMSFVFGSFGMYIPYIYLVSFFAFPVFPMKVKTGEIKILCNFTIRPAFLIRPPRVYSYDVTAAILLSKNNETAAMLASQTSPLGVVLFSYANAFFYFNKCA